MKACVLDSPAPIESNPLVWRDIPRPEPQAGQVLVQVRACGICRTDLHVIEGELPRRKMPLTPGHQVVGVIAEQGRGASRYALGARVGIAWLHATDGICEYCRAGKENLCEEPAFTGYTVDGGFAEYALAEEDFVYPIPDGFADEHAAPLLCAGIIGYRSLRLANLPKNGRLGLYGFGAAAHVAIQVARHWGCEVFVCTRDRRHQNLATELGAVWVGGAIEQPPVGLDSAIVFAPAGEIVPAALKALKKGGVLALGGIHMSPIPQFDYSLIYGEREMRSVANHTREDGHEFLKVAAEIPIRTQIERFPMQDANQALNALKNDAIRGAAVLTP